MEKGPVVLLIIGLASLGAGIARFVHLGPWAMLQGLYCLISIAGALILLLIADYTLHHARLAFLIVLAFLVVLVVTSPSFCVGLGVALVGIVARGLRS
ncbi:MAG TPA: hypothetical protein VKW06_01285 [Candidatus Angelobacter sp.]|nr:hypothetical protein [Candidatus Angelobacter sp.]